MNYMKLKNTSIYIIPVWFGDLNIFCSKLEKDGRWARIDPNEYSPRYIYSQMYEILSIESLLKDIQDNELQIKRLRDVRAKKSERQTHTLLMGISFLSVFSALIDFADFVDRFGAPVATSTAVSLISIFGSLFLYMLRRYQKR